MAGRLARTTVPAREALNQAAERLRASGIDTPRLDARLLVAYALGVAPEMVPLDPIRPVDAATLEALVARRAGHEPLALILGRREFWSLDFAVSPATLIPRPDSETLVEAALAAFANRMPPRRVLDLGTGTGCLLLAVLSEFSAAFGVGVDCCFAAAALAARNAAALGLAARAAFLCGDWAAALDARFDLVLSNPPYIATGQLAFLMPEVAGFEPPAALDGGADGLCAYRTLLPALARLLARDGIAVLEVGAGQAETVARMAGNAGYVAVPRPDLAGIPRALALHRVPP